MERAGLPTTLYQSDHFTLSLDFRGGLDPTEGSRMKLGTSLRFLFPTGPQSYAMFKRALESLREVGGR